MSVFQRVISIFRKTNGVEKAPPPVERGWTDREIRSKKEDSFDFQDYAEVLAGRARRAEPPLTIGLYGSWGSGKTSLMRLIEAELQGIETIWINVWQLSNQEEVWQAFLQALFNRVNHELPWWRRVQWRKLGRELMINSYRIVVVIIPILFGGLIGNPEAGWVDVFSFLANPLKSTPAGTLTSFGLFLWIIVKPAIEAAREVVDIDLTSVLKYGSYKEQISELMELQGRFSKMVEDLVGIDGRLVVFIDDLDRCAPNKIPDLLEAIKLFTTTPKCVYVLGLDHDIVRQGISKKYQFEDEREAAEYLEKIVQVPFHLPPLDEGKVEVFVRVSYPDVNERCQTAAAVFARGLEPNPRKVKRALNIYRTVLELADKRVSVWEMDPIDDELAAKMMVIQSRYPELHNHLALQPEFLTDIEGQVLTDKDIEIQKSKAKLQESEIGKILIGDGKAPGLIDQSELHGLVAMLRVGDKHFNDPDQKDQISSYIFLIATAEGVATGVRPNRLERDRLLGGDPQAIETQVEEIKKRAAVATYIRRLEGVLVDHARYTPAEVVSANLALDLLEGWERWQYEPPTVRIPAGDFLMGATEEQVQESVSSLSMEFPPDMITVETPQRIVELSTYRIGRYPVTNLEYREFVKSTGHKPPDYWQGRDFFEDKGRYPVVEVSYQDALDYCDWLSKKTGRIYRLPTEAEWEKAARGLDGRVYPWGSDWDASRCNTSERGIYETIEVGKNTRGDSPYGAGDMAGNIFEWCADWFGPYDIASGGVLKDPQVQESGDHRVLRGGSFNHDRVFARVSSRNKSTPDLHGPNYGFRVVFALNISEWHRKKIDEWEQPTSVYKTIPLITKQATVNYPDNYPDINIPFRRPLFGQMGIPFELNVEVPKGTLRGIELGAPHHPDATLPSETISPGAKNVISAYVLITAGNAQNVVKDIELAGKRIGYLDFYFEEGDPYRVDLVLGKNIREWAYKTPEVIKTISDNRVEQVWRDNEDKVTVDMLRVDFPEPPRNVTDCQVVFDPEEALQTIKDKLPTVRISGLTYYIDLLDDLLAGEAETSNAHVEALTRFGLEQEYMSRLKGVLVDHANFVSTQVVSANLALDLLEGWERWEYEPQTLRVPAGSFLMGSTSEQEGSKDEQPQHNIELAGYRIGKYPVTNAEYQAFVEDSQHAPPSHWDKGAPPLEKSDHPVVNVSWHDAMVYCRWLSEKSGKSYRLPSEAEWEKAARGEDGRIYPWGDEFDPQRFNTSESGVGDTTPAGQYSPQGDAPYGCADMAGNVWDWCADWFSDKEYERRAGGEVRDPPGPDRGDYRVLRGGSWDDLRGSARCAFRYWLLPDGWSLNLGFRVVVSPA